VRPSPKACLSAEDIAKGNTGVDLPYLLDMQPSVVVGSDGGTGIGYTNMRIRGSDATRTNITLNGVPFNDAESQGAFLVNLPDLATSAEDIEIQRGVGTSTNGPGAFGASVNLRTTSVKREAWGLIDAGAGSYNTQRYSVSAGTGLINDKFSLDMRLSSITSDGYIDRASADLKSYFLQGAWVGKTRSLRFITFRGVEETYQAWDGVPREVIDTNRTYNGFTYDNQVDHYDQTHYQLLFDQTLGANTTLNLTLFRVNGAGYYEQFRPDDDLATYGITTAVINGDSISTTDLIRRRWLANTLTGCERQRGSEAGHAQTGAGRQLQRLPWRTLRRSDLGTLCGKHGHPPIATMMTTRRNPMPTASRS
jgi:iron complex outermembrane receptor protein